MYVGVSKPSDVHANSYPSVVQGGSGVGKPSSAYLVARILEKILKGFTLHIPKVRCHRFCKTQHASFTQWSSACTIGSLSTLTYTEFDCAAHASYVMN